MPLTVSMMRTIIVCSASLALAGCIAKSVGDAAFDPKAYRYMEALEGEKALDWVGAQNAKTRSFFGKDETYRHLRDRFVSGPSAPRRILAGALLGDTVFAYDKAHVKPPGALLSMSVEAYANGGEWRERLNFADLLGANETGLVPRPFDDGMQCAPHKPSRCLIRFSVKGSDAAILREADLETGTFVQNGFETRTAQRIVARWLDADHLVVSAHKPSSALSTPGYPKEVWLWRRGQSLEDAKRVFSGVDGGAQYVIPAVLQLQDQNQPTLFVVEALGLSRTRLHRIDADRSLIGEIDAPDINILGAGVLGVVGRQLILHTANGADLPPDAGQPGGLAALDLTTGRTKAVLKVGGGVSFPGRGSAVIVGDCVLAAPLDNVRSKIVKLCPGDDGHWNETEMAPPDATTIRFLHKDPTSTVALVETQSITEPPSHRLYANSTLRSMHREQTSEFDARDLVTEQYTAIADDGAPIPYFVVRPRHIDDNGAAPVLMTGYGAFGLSMTPRYLSNDLGGKAVADWLAHGNILVLPILRGGGEFGASWHHAARREKRQRSYDDFFAVADDLIKRGVTRPGLIGFRGVSNGGLLGGVMLTQRPDLFGAAILAAPLADMLRYDQLLGGRIWRDEYGDPADPAMRRVLRSYSPFHNVRDGHSYPPVFIYASRHDDRVHPAHGRKLAARLNEVGADVLYLEQNAGGHGMELDADAKARLRAMEASFLISTLGGPHDPN